MKKRTVSKTICGRLLWIFVLLLLLTACGKKEQTAVDGDASSLDAQAEEIATGNAAQNDAERTEDGQSGPDFESGDLQDGDRPGTEDTRNEQNSEAQTAQDGQERETGTVQNGQFPEDGQNREAGDTLSGDSRETVS